MKNLSSLKGAPSAKHTFNTSSAHHTNGQKDKPSRVTLRLSAQERLLLDKAASGMSASAYIRRCLFGKNASLRKVNSRAPVRSERLLSKILGKLGQAQIANNLNQIAYEAKCGSLLLDVQTERDIKLACAQIAWIRVQLIEALGLEAKGKKASN